MTNHTSTSCVEALYVLINFVIFPSFERDRERDAINHLSRATALISDVGWHGN